MQWKIYLQFQTNRPNHIIYNDGFKTVYLERTYVYRTVRLCHLILNKKYKKGFRNSLNTHRSIRNIQLSWLPLHMENLVNLVILFMYCNLPCSQVTGKWQKLINLLTITQERDNISNHLYQLRPSCGHWQTAASRLELHQDIFE